MKTKNYINYANFVVKAAPMSKWEFAKNYPKHMYNMVSCENKNINGFFCDWNGYKFWVEEDWFNIHYKEYDK